MPVKLPRLAALLALAVVGACAGSPPEPLLATAPPDGGAAAPATAAPAPAPSARFTILQINDVYRIEGIEGRSKGGLSRVRALRKELEREGRPVLVLHAGDLLFPSVMSKFLEGEPMVKVLNLLDGDPIAFDRRLVITFGNHEFDSKDPGILLGRVAESDFSWVSSNTRYVTAKGAPGEPFSRRLANVSDTLILPVDGVKVGILGLTTDVQPRDYVSYAFGDGGAPTTPCAPPSPASPRAAPTSRSRSPTRSSTRTCSSPGASRRSTWWWAGTSTSSWSGRWAAPGSPRPTPTR